MFKFKKMPEVSSFSEKRLK